MGINVNVDVKDETEFNQQLQLYLAQGYNMQSNFNGTAILKKKSYSVGLLIVLIIIFFPAAIIYYLAASDDVVTIRNNNGQISSTNAGTATESFDSYCEECGQGLYKDSKFCPGCGRDLTESVDDSVEVISEEIENVEESLEETEIIEEEVLKCGNCGVELTEENKFCPECGEKVSANEDE